MTTTVGWRNGNISLLYVIYIFYYMLFVWYLKVQYYMLKVYNITLDQTVEKKKKHKEIRSNKPITVINKMNKLEVCNQ
jgi:hypothetical protein